jgi:hypothetical protein
MPGPNPQTQLDLNLNPTNTSVRTTGPKDGNGHEPEGLTYKGDEMHEHERLECRNDKVDELEELEYEPKCDDNEADRYVYPNHYFSTPAPTPHTCNILRLSQRGHMTAFQHHASPFNDECDDNDDDLPSQLPTPPPIIKPTHYMPYHYEDSDSNDDGYSFYSNPNSTKPDCSDPTPLEPDHHNKMAMEPMTMETS